MGEAMLGSCAEFDLVGDLWESAAVTWPQMAAAANST